jgi:hypothetical protein
MTENQAETHPAKVSEDLLTETQQTESKANEADGSNGKQDQDQTGDFVKQPSNKDGRTISLRKLEANRRNAQKSTGPKTVVGKAISSWNSLKHGLLSRRLYEHSDQTAEKFFHLLSSLQQDLERAPWNKFWWRRLHTNTGDSV